MAATPFRVVLSGDSRSRMAHPHFRISISPLQRQPGVECQFLDRCDEIRADQAWRTPTP